MMTEARRSDAPCTLEPIAIEADPLVDVSDRPAPEVLRLLAIGSPVVVDDCVLTLYRLGYARPEEWSRPLPTVNPGEVMRILTKRVIAVGQG